MSYANGTTHYNLPQTVGTDKRDWFDTNQPFADIDEALYGAVQQSTSTATAVTALTTRVGNVESDIATIQSSQSTDEANIAALQTLVNQHTSEIADVKADALDMICAVDEGTAQVATVAVSEGHYFRYNDVLYMATANIAVGDTIVPNTNCRATNVATELEAIAPSGETVDETARQEIGNLSSLQTTSKVDLVSAINEVLSQIGGGGMPNLNYSTPLHDFTTGNLSFTASTECYVSGDVLAGSEGAVNTLTINNTVITRTTSAVLGYYIPPIKINAGDVVAVTQASQYLHVFGLAE